MPKKVFHTIKKPPTKPSAPPGGSYHKPYPAGIKKGPHKVPPMQQGQKVPTQVHKPIMKPPKKQPYRWMQRDQQRLSNQYGLTTYNVDGTVSTVPQSRLPDGVPYDPNATYKFHGDGTYTKHPKKDYGEGEIV